MSHTLNECSQCGERFANELKKLEHICPSKESDRKMWNFLESIRLEGLKGANDGLTTDTSGESRPLQDVLHPKRQGS